MKAARGQWVFDLLGLAGAAALVYGAGQAWRPAAWLIGGAFAIILALALGARRMRGRG